MAFDFSQDIQSYKAELKKLTSNANTAKANLVSKKNELDEINKRIRELHKQTINTTTAMENINRMLVEAGTQGFYLEPHETIDNAYKLVRSDGQLAKNLSEGEKTLIAFLYFYHLVTGSDNSEGINSKAKIVIIDDPVSSIDSKNLFIISTLVRNLINIYIKAADQNASDVNVDYIKLIFILTHNVYFHKEVTRGFEKFNDSVSFFRLWKDNERSSIKICEKYSDSNPTEKVNNNPIKNEYMLLWAEYKHAESSITFLSCMRRILDYFFLQICNLDVPTLTKAILDNHRSNFISTAPETGEENAECLEVASMLLSCIESSISFFNDGLYYVDGSFSTEQCRKGFREIFDCMGHLPHFNMMMENS